MEEHRKSHETIEVNLPPNGNGGRYVTNSWLVGILIVIVGALITMLVHNFDAQLTNVNAKADTATQSVTNAQSQLKSISALLIIIAEKQGISDQEINTLLSQSQ